jgi:hypothetical protein
MVTETATETVACIGSSPPGMAVKGPSERQDHADSHPPLSDAAGAETPTPATSKGRGSGAQDRKSDSWPMRKNEPDPRSETPHESRSAPAEF